MTDYFVIQPENQSYVQRRTDQPAYIPNNWNKFIIMALIVLYLFVFGALGMATYNMHKENILFQDSAQTTARITGHNSQRSRNTTNYYLMYMYSVDGEIYRDSRRVSRSVYNTYRVGDIVDILYPVAKHDLTRIIGVHGDERVEVFGAFSIAFAALAGYGVFWVIKRYRNVKLLRSNGRLMTGELIASSTREYKGNYYVRFTVQFTNPNYERIKGSRQYMVNQLRNAPLPSAGTPLAIIYYHDKLWELL